MITDKDLKAWDIYNSIFKDGDEVIVLDVDDNFLWGILESTEKHCILRNPRTGKVNELDWEDVRFIAHDGFPVRKLTGADGSKLIEQLDTSDIQRFLRESTTLTLCRNCEKIIEENHNNFYGVSGLGRLYECNECRKKRRATFGDPYFIEDFSAKIINPGNFWGLDKYWTKQQWDYEEVMILHHKGGAQALLWCIDTIYHFE